jgi:drug/metabolite transporter (DMT)-like permease
MWSLQYIFLRVAVPAFGTAAVAEGRALFAALFLLPWVAWVARQRIGPLEHWKDHLAVALVNNVAPFVCFAWAASVLPAGYLAVSRHGAPGRVIAVPVLLSARLRRCRVLLGTLGLRHATSARWSSACASSSPRSPASRAPGSGAGPAS